MLKKMILLAMALAAMTALAIPALASAKTVEWTKDGATLTTNDKIHFEGSAKFESAALGSVSCAKATSVIELTKGTDVGHATQFTVVTPSECHVGGFLGSTCGTNSLTEANLQKNAFATGTTNGQVHISNVTLLNKFGSCLTLHLTNEATPTVIATLDSTTAAKTAALSGTLKDSLGGTVKVTGDLNITAAEAGRYGIATF